MNSFIKKFKHIRMPVHFVAIFLVVTASILTFVLFSSLMGSASDGKDPADDPDNPTSPGGTPGGQTLPTSGQDDPALMAGEKNPYVTTFVLAGVDNLGGTTDTLMLVRLDTQNYTLNILQIPRDTYVETDLDDKKINGAYTYGRLYTKNNADGAKKLMATIEENFGVRPDHYIIMYTKAFRQLVDEIDGVYIDVPTALNYDDPGQGLSIHIKAGPQTLNGKDAEGFMRFRMGYVEGDIGRVKAQKLFITAFAKTVLNLDNMIMRLPGLAQVIIDNMVTDMNEGDILNFGRELMKLDMDNMFVYQVPGEEHNLFSQVDGRMTYSYYMAYNKETLELINGSFSQHVDKPLESIGIPERWPRNYKESVFGEGGASMSDIDANGEKIPMTSGGGSSPSSGSSTTAPSSGGDDDDNDDDDTGTTGDGTTATGGTTASEPNGGESTTVAAVSSGRDVKVNYCCEDADKVSDFVRRLQAVGYNVTRVSQLTGVTYNTSAVVAHTGGDASPIAGLIPFAAVTDVADAQTAVDFSIVLGMDFDENY